MSRVLSLLLALVMVLTTQQLALARGQVPVAGEMVLCVGGGLVSVPVDANGNPAGPHHACPDGVLAFAGLALPPLQAPRTDTITVADMPPGRTQNAMTTDVTRPAARGPPPRTV